MYFAYKPVKLANKPKTMGTGWLPPLPDNRDFTDDKKEIKGIFKSVKKAPTAQRVSLPDSVDLRPYCSPIESQLGLGSCTAHAGVGIVEYFEKRSFDKHMEGSRLFVYKTTRNLMGVTGDTGAWCRVTMGALAMFGVPPEHYWPYNDLAQPGPDGEPAFDDEPTAFVYSLADNYEALKYFCHDPLISTKPRKEILQSVKKYLAAGIPSMFGFWGFDSCESSDEPGAIPYPCPWEQAKWGHAVAAVGYNDKKKIVNTISNHKTTGALLIRNSWGEDWGDGGYGWLPYDYVLDKIALDFWSLLSMKWIDRGEFGL